MTKIAVVSFPGNNCEVESLRALRRNGMEAVFFRWNEDRSVLDDVDGYFIPGGFSYEDRGRAGMVAGRDSMMRLIKEEAEKGKVVIGNCNGAQIIIESGLVPLGEHLDMCLARNVVENKHIGFVSEWVWITPTCKRGRCASSDWEGVMHLPIAHGEGRFVTKDSNLIAELKDNDQLAFSYCDAEGNVSQKHPVTPNGSVFGVAGICNPEGNVIALMPHPERTALGDRYFRSIKGWIENKTRYINVQTTQKRSSNSPDTLKTFQSGYTEVFIDTKIVNNEERTVEQAAKRINPKLSVKQLKYLSTSADPSELLRHISLFNPNKEVAYVRSKGMFQQWNSSSKKFEDCAAPPYKPDVTLLRVDLPEHVNPRYGSGAKAGVCYALTGVRESDFANRSLREIFANPHASELSFLA